MILQDCEIWFAKLNPNKPNSRFDSKRPTWEIQIRTEDKAVKKFWEENNLGVKLMDPDEGEMFYRVNLKKKSIKASGEANAPVDVKDGNLNDVDPMSIGNGSIGNVRIFQYEYDKQEGGKGIASVLMGIQLTTHILYVPKERDDDFEKTETTIVTPTVEDMEDGVDAADASAESASTAPVVSVSVSPKSPKADDQF